MSFKDSKHIKISGGTFTSVKGDLIQNTYNNSPPNDQLRLDVREVKLLLKKSCICRQIERKSEGLDDIFEEFQTIRRGDIRVVRAIVNLGVEADDSQKELHNLRGSRAIANVRVLGPGSGSDFLQVSYEGDDAEKIWRKDLLSYAYIQHPNVVQLFGINYFPSPSLVFYEENIPLAEAFYQVRCIYKSPLALCCFQFRARMDWNAAQKVVGRKYINYKVRQGLWLQPNNGLICYGPPIQDLLDKRLTFNLLNLRFDRLKLKPLPPLPVHFYGDDKTLLGHYDGYSKSQGLEEGFLGLAAQYSESGYGYFTLRQMDCMLHPLDIGSVLAHSKVVGQIPWSPEFTQIQPWYMDIGRAERKFLRNGWTRFTFNPGDSLDLKIRCYMSISHEAQTRLRSSYLAQQHCILRSLQSNSGYLSLFDRVSLKLETGYRPQLMKQQSRPLHLFVAPFGARGHLSEILSDWRQPYTHYWSWDSAGSHPMPKEALELFGIPTLTEYLAAPDYWPDFYYEAARRVQEVEGFDPCTTDYARAHGYPIVEVYGTDEKDQDIQSDGGSIQKLDFNLELPLDSASRSDTDLSTRTIHENELDDEDQDYVQPRYLSKKSPRWWQATLGRVVPKYRRRGFQNWSLEDDLGLEKQKEGSSRASRRYMPSQPRFRRRSIG